MLFHMHVCLQVSALKGKVSELDAGDGGVVVMGILESCISRKIPHNFGGHMLGNHG